MRRQWQILQLLTHSRAGLRAIEIEQRLDDPPVGRTVFRDLEFLQEMFGVYSEGGRWFAAARDRAPMPLTAADAVGLFLCLDALAPLGGALEASRAVANLRSVVLAALPEKARVFAEELRNTQIATFTMPAVFEQDAAEALEQGCHLEQSVRLVYRAGGGVETQRLIDPHALWFVDGRLYVIAYCHLRHAFRRFAMSRVQEATLTEQTFERDPGFTPQAHAKGGFGVWVGDAYDVELLFTQEVAHLAEERQLGEGQLCTHLPDGCVRLNVRLAGLPALARWVAGTGGAVRPAAPVQLVEMVRDIHLAGLRASGAKPPARALTPLPAAMRDPTGSEQ